MQNLTTLARNLRKSSTDAEKKLWRCLRTRQMEGLKFRRQQQIGRFIVDFVCFEKKLIIEADGGQHAVEESRDALRTGWLTEQGFTVLRFWNHDVLKNIDGVLEKIRERCLAPPHPDPLPRGERGVKRQQLCGDQRGAVLLMVLVSVTLLGLMAGIAGSSWQTYMQKSKEAELLWKGNQIREAIGRYYNFVAAGAKQTGSKTIAKKSYPQTLEDLLEDPRALETTRHLRSLYPDPVTGEEWVEIRSPQGGGIMGIKSSSVLKPFKQYGFSEENKNFALQKEYAAWHFIYSPKKAQKAQTSKATPAQTEQE